MLFKLISVLRRVFGWVKREIRIRKYSFNYIFNFERMKETRWYDKLINDVCSNLIKS